jgi:hypothetical protein
MLLQSTGCVDIYVVVFVAVRKTVVEQVLKGATIVVYGTILKNYHLRCLSYFKYEYICV